MSHYVAVTNLETMEFEHHKVNPVIYDYIRQLEMALKYPSQTGLFNIYPHLKPKTENDNIEE